MKTCSKCKKKKELTCFSTDNSRKDKKTPQCKLCGKQNRLVWYRKNKTKVSQRMKKYRQKPEVKARSWEVEKKRRALKRDEHLAKRREWAKKNKEKVRDSLKKWRESNKEHVLVYAKEHKLKNRQRYTYYQLQRKAKQMNAEGNYTLQEFQDLKQKHKNKCLKCGKKEGNVKITADHVVPLSKGGSNSIKNIQPLCLSCNCKKHAKTADYRH